jgi:hypothetical protein
VCFRARLPDLDSMPAVIVTAGFLSSALFLILR